MKQPMNFRKGKACSIRQMREMAAGLKRRASVYSRVDKWEEEEAGTANFKITVTLLPHWSFSQEDYVNQKSFSDTSLAMRGVSMTYPVTEDMILRASFKTDLDRLTALIEATSRKEDL